MTNASNQQPASRFVILGASGDMARTKLIPALWSLEQRSALGSPYNRKLAGSDVLSQLEGRSAYLHVPTDAAHNVTVTRGISRVVWDETGDDLTHRGTYQKIKERLESLPARGSANPLATHFYCAVRPSLYEPIAEHLVDSDLLPRQQDEGMRSLLILEKPLGFDSGSAKALEALFKRNGLHDRVLLVDHYLYKPMVERLLQWRFSDGDAKALWRPENIDHVQITVAESETTNKQPETYNELGALGDMIQSHLLLLLRVATMAPEDSITSSDGLRFLDKIEPYQPNDGGWVVLGQCLAGEPPGIEVETFAALRLQTADGPWAGIPFFLRTGKQMQEKVTSIAVKFKGDNDDAIVCRIQPEPAITVRRNGQKETVVDLRSESVLEHATIYREIIDQGALSRGVTYAWAIAAWDIVERARRQATRLAPYATKSDGPAEADLLLTHTGRTWLSTDDVMDRT